MYPTSDLRQQRPTRRMKTHMCSAREYCFCSPCYRFKKKVLKSHVCLGISLSQELFLPSNPNLRTTTSIFELSPKVSISLDLQPDIKHIRCRIFAIASSEHITKLRSRYSPRKSDDRSRNDPTRKSHEFSSRPANYRYIMCDNMN